MKQLVKEPAGAQGAAVPDREPAYFDKRATNVAKGAAVCLLLIHHLYMGVLPAPISLFGNSPVVVFATLAKVCVAIFALLSGYGLTRSYANPVRQGGAVRFVADHFFKLMRQYWSVFVLFFILSVFFGQPGESPAVYGEGARGALAAFLDFLGLRPLFGTGTLNQTWWYMEAVIVLYRLFPLLYRLTDRLPYLSLPLTALPLVLYFFFGNNVWDTCREIYWFFPFTAGIFLAQRGWLDRFAAFTQRRGGLAALFSCGALLLNALLRAKIGLAFDTFFAVAILLFLVATVCRVRPLSFAAAFAGKYSADVFMLHSFFYCYFVWKKPLLFFLWSTSDVMQLLAFPVLLAESLTAAWLLAFLRRRTGYDVMFDLDRMLGKKEKR